MISLISGHSLSKATLNVIFVVLVLRWNVLNYLAVTEGVEPSSNDRQSIILPLYDATKSATLNLNP